MATPFFAKTETPVYELFLHHPTVRFRWEVIQKCTDYWWDELLRTNLHLLRHLNLIAYAPAIPGTSPELWWLIAEPTGAAEPPEIQAQAEMLPYHEIKEPGRERAEFYSIRAANEEPQSPANA